MMKKTIVVFIGSILLSLSSFGQMSVAGKIRTLRPVSMSLEGMDGKQLFKIDIVSGQEFASTPLEITPDYYVLKIGEYQRWVLLENKPVKIKGFLDDQNSKNSELQFQGLDLNDQKEEVAKVFNKKRTKESWEAIVQNNNVLICAALIKETPVFFKKNISLVKEVLDKIEPKDQSVVLFKELADFVSEQERFSVGAEVIPFELPDQNGKLVSSKEFEGKLILLDFWASWCGPCRAEMKSLQKIYEEIKNDDLVFISVSLDDSKEKWLKALEADNIPWVSLWDKDGWKKSRLREQFGFNQIPYIVLIGKDGKILSRKIRGEEVKNEILKYNRDK